MSPHVWLALGPSGPSQTPTALLLGFVAFTGFVAPVVVAVVRARRRPGTRTSPDGPLSAVPGIVAFVRAQLP